VTRWYTAPEILLCNEEATPVADVWSVGCIFAELLARTVFLPGEDFTSQLRLMREKVGRPNDDDLDFVTSARARRFLASLPNQAPPPLADLFPAHAGETNALDLLRCMLVFHPDRRINVERALEHPFLASLHNPEDEPVANFSFSYGDDFGVNEDMNIGRVRELVWEEMRKCHPEIPEVHPSAQVMALGRTVESKSEI